MPRILPKDAYVEPSEILEKQEAKTCKGCVYEVRRKTDHHSWGQVCAWLGRASPQRCSKFESRDE